MEEKKEENGFKETAYLSVAELIGHDRVFFRDLIKHYEDTYGLFLSGEGGLELFWEICLPEIKLAREQCSVKNLHYLFGQYNTAIWNEDHESSARLLAEIGELGVPGGAVDNSVNPFLVSDKFIAQLKEFKALLEEDKFEEARWFFVGVNKKYLFSSVEFLALKAYHLAVRKVVFLVKTNPTLAVDECPRIIKSLEGAIERFLLAAEGLKNFKPPKRYQIWRPSRKVFEWGLLQNTTVC